MAVDKRKKTICRIVEQTDGIKRYWKDFRKYKSLTAEQERDLFMQYKNADKKDREKIETILVMSNQRLIYSKALDFTKDPDLIQDYIREGSIGLLKAVERFDLSAGVRFMTFAMDYIYREMFEYNSKYGSLVRRSNDKKIGLRLKAIRDRFYTENEREATNDEIREIFQDKYGIEIKEDVDMLDVNMTSIDDSENAEGDSNDLTETGEFAVATASFNSFIAKEEDEHMHRVVNALLGKLDERSRAIVKLAYGIDCDYPVDPDDIAEKFKITRTRVNQILAAALQDMRKP